MKLSYTLLPSLCLQSTSGPRLVIPTCPGRGFGPCQARAHRHPSPRRQPHRLPEQSHRSQALRGKLDGFDGGRIFGKCAVCGGLVPHDAGVLRGTTLPPSLPPYLPTSLPPYLPPCVFLPHECRCKRCNFASHYHAHFPLPPSPFLPGIPLSP